MYLYKNQNLVRPKFAFGLWLNQYDTRIYNIWKVMHIWTYPEDCHKLWTLTICLCVCVISFFVRIYLHALSSTFLPIILLTISSTLISLHLHLLRFTPRKLLVSLVLPQSHVYSLLFSTQALRLLVRTRWPFHMLSLNQLIKFKLNHALM